MRLMQARLKQNVMAGSSLKRRGIHPRTSLRGETVGFGAAIQYALAAKDVL